jgi:hypothetical protein
VILNIEEIKLQWQKFSKDHKLRFETSERNIMLAGKKTELILSAESGLSVRGVFQLDINGWGQGRGTLNKTTVSIPVPINIDLIKNKELQMKFGYKRYHLNKDELIIEYNFLFYSKDSFDLFEEFLSMAKIEI